VPLVSESVWANAGLSDGGIKDRLQRLIGASLTAIIARHLGIAPFGVKEFFRHLGNIVHVLQEFVEHS
jgi:hypothetical protein